MTTASRQCQAPEMDKIKSNLAAQNDVEHMVDLLEAPGIKGIIPEDLVDEIPDEE